MYENVNTKYHKYNEQNQISTIMKYNYNNKNPTKKKPKKQYNNCETWY